MADCGHQVVATAGNAGDLLAEIAGHHRGRRANAGYTGEDLRAAIADPARLRQIEQLRGAPWPRALA
jgi:hypothetical protein